SDEFWMPRCRNASHSDFRWEDRFEHANSAGLSMTPSTKSSRTASDTLFDNSSPARPESWLVAHVDGGARGNPGPAGYGVVLQDQSGRRIAALSEYLGHQTNNFAEYNGLIAALEYALEHNW